MTFNTSGNVTHAGWKNVNQPHPDWVCKCGAENRGYRAQCQSCNDKCPDRR